MLLNPQVFLNDPRVILDLIKPKEENAKEDEEEVENHLELVSCSRVMVEEKVAEVSNRLKTCIIKIIDWWQ